MCIMEERKAVLLALHGCPPLDYPKRGSNPVPDARSKGYKKVAQIYSHEHLSYKGGRSPAQIFPGQDEHSPPFKAAQALSGRPTDTHTSERRQYQPSFPVREPERGFLM